MISMEWARKKRPKDKDILAVKFNTDDEVGIEKYIKLAKKQGFATELSTNFGGQITVITIRGISFHDAMALEKLVED